MFASVTRRALLATSAMLLLASNAGATDYKFRISCQSRSSVIQWSTGAIDPGREFLRVTTGLKNPNCSVGDYNPTFDAGLPVEKLSDMEAVIQGSLPIIGLILLGLSGRG
ncbi:hypothetical protein K9U40_11985 [Xanthobacter autotrophicus]|uniref:hypothetical protein n=1 Tax=Xanthobacter TaxID=279 RepID=UPI0024AB11B8|nr:hypothetical protein [Xanthobacter autotrophicus]MDI4665044.1 hypothetical protein [Xanthobacter autotrophicus]